MTAISDDVLVIYYDLRSKAEERHEAMRAGSTDAGADPMREAFEARSQEIYRGRLGNLRGLDVGEVGGGGGDFAEYAISQGVASLLLIDISSDRLRVVEERLRRQGNTIPTRFITADAKRLAGVEDASLDLLVAKEVIEHLTDYRPFLRECARVVKPGGRLYLTTPNRRCVDLWPRLAFKNLAPRPKRTGDALVREVFGHLYDRLTPEEVQTLAGVLPPGFREHIYEFAPAELLRELSAHGLQPERMWGTPPQMFYHELRALAPKVIERWNDAEGFSYRLGDDLRVIARKV